MPEDEMDIVIPDAMEELPEGQGYIEHFLTNQPVKGQGGHLHVLGFGVGYTMLRHDEAEEPEVFAYLELDVAGLGRLPNLVIPLESFRSLIGLINEEMQTSTHLDRITWPEDD